MDFFLGRVYLVLESDGVGNNGSLWCDYVIELYDP